MHRRSHVTGYNITYSLLLSISTTSLIFPPSVIVNFRKIISAQRKLKSRIFVLKCCYFVTEFSNLFQHITASICGGIYARVCCILYCLYDVVVRKTAESDRQDTNPNPKPYFVAVKYGGLASLYRKFTFAISHRLMSFLYFFLHRQDSQTPPFPGYHLHCPLFSLTFTASNTSSVRFLQTCIRIRNIKYIS